MSINFHVHNYKLYIEPTYESFVRNNTTFYIVRNLTELDVVHPQKHMLVVDLNNANWIILRYRTKRDHIHVHVYDIAQGQYLVKLLEVNTKMSLKQAFIEIEKANIPDYLKSFVEFLLIPKDVNVIIRDLNVLKIREW